MKLIEMLDRLEAEGRVEEAEDHVFKVYINLGCRGYNPIDVLRMEVEAVIDLLEEHPAKPGWDSTIYGTGELEVEPK